MEEFRSIASVLKRSGRIVEREVPSLGITVRVKVLTAAEMLAIVGLPAERQTYAGIAACIVDEAGKPVYASPEEVEAGEFVIYAALGAVVTSVNSLDIEAASKNSKAPPSSG